MMAIFADVLDHMEGALHFRVDGLSASVMTTISTVAIGIGSGVFNMMLVRTGYIHQSLSTGRL